MPAVIAICYTVIVVAGIVCAVLAAIKGHWGIAIAIICVVALLRVSWRSDESSNR